MVVNRPPGNGNVKLCENLKVIFNKIDIKKAMEYLPSKKMRLSFKLPMRFSVVM